MHVETTHSDTELLTFGSIAATILAGLLPWVDGDLALMPVAAALTVGCGLAADAVVLYGDGSPTDAAALLGLGATVLVLAIRSFERFSVDGVGSVGRSPGVGVFLAALAGLALTALAARRCRAAMRAGSVDAESDSTGATT